MKTRTLRLKARRWIHVTTLTIGAPLLLWMLTMNMYGSFLLVLVGYVLIRRFPSFNLKGKTISVLISVPCILLFWQTPIEEYANQITRLEQKLTSNRFSRVDLAGIYGLNIAMAAAGWFAGYPEVAKETLLLSYPGPKKRLWKSDFAMRSPRVRKAITAMIRELKKKRLSIVDLPRERIVWYNYDPPVSRRVALALNSPLFLSGKAVRTPEGHWVLKLKAEAKIQYPIESQLTLWKNFRGKDIYIQEGLFRALSDRGWHFPYTAVWTWEVRSDDPQLKDLRTAHLSWREILSTLFW